MLDSATPAVANVIQVALTPVFLLAGTAGCLNVFATRLGRLSDRVNDLFTVLKDEENLDSVSVRRLTDLRRRTLALEVAVMMGSISGVFTCLSTLGLLIGALREEFREQILIWCFTGAVIALIGSFVAFLYEMGCAGRSMLRQISRDRVIRRRHRAATRRPATEKMQHDEIGN